MWEVASRILFSEHECHMPLATYHVLPATTLTTDY